MPVSVILTNLYKEYSLHRRHTIWGVSTIPLQKIGKDDHKTITYSSRLLSPTKQRYIYIPQYYKSKVILQMECMTLRLEGYNFNFETR